MELGGQQNWKWEDSGPGLGGQQTWAGRTVDLSWEVSGPGLGRQWTWEGAGRTADLGMGGQRTWAGRTANLGIGEEWPLRFLCRVISHSSLSTRIHLFNDF